MVPAVGGILPSQPGIPEETEPCVKIQKRARLRCWPVSTAERVGP